MGSILSRRRHRKRHARRQQNNNRRMAFSTQSLNIEPSIPHPNLYASPESAQPSPWYQSLQDLRDQAVPSVQQERTRILLLPSVSRPKEMPHIYVSEEEEDNDKVNEEKETRNNDYTESEKEENDNLSEEESDDYDLVEEEKEENDKVNEEKETKINDSTESDSKPKLNADGNYRNLSAHGTDTGFRKADIPQLITDGEIKGWYFVRNVETGEESYVHKDWITMTTSDDVQSQAFFFNEFDRKIAEVKLLERGIEIGTYLLRPSSEDGYALSLRCENGSRLPKIRHYKVRVSDKGLFYIDSDSSNNTFSNIVELIRYYSENPGLHSKLKKPLPRDIQLNDLACKVSDLILGEKLGFGNFGSVYAGTLHNNKEVAVKLLNDGGSMTVEQFRKEAETMHKLRHPNLVSLLAICEDSGKIFIITERMSKGALLDLLREDTGKTIEFKDLMDMAIQVAEGMYYLEKMRFVHRDLRAENVLVGDGNIAKIADFGLARLLDRYYENDVFYEGKKGSFLPCKWTAPEGLRQLKFTVKSDVWSFGILLYEMVTYGDNPYPAMSNPEALDWLEKGNRLKRPTKHHCPLALYGLMKQCWQMNSNERPNFEYVKEALTGIKTARF